MLNDDDGTLTGLTSPVGLNAKNETISVNQEHFFDAPTETSECASDIALDATNGSKCPPATAKTSPYEYVTAAIYPECALSVPDSSDLVRKCSDDSWGSNCANPPGERGGCVGVPLYRQLLVKGEDEGLDQVKRMMGQNSFQRSGLTANHGDYYIDTTVSKKTQENHQAQSVNVFTAGGKYDLYFLYAKPDTQQTYTMFVGKNIPDSNGQSFAQTNVKFGYVDIAMAKYTFSEANGGKLPPGWSSAYEPKDGILTLTTDMSGIKDAFDLTKTVPGSEPPVTLGQELCQPATMCRWNGTDAKCECNPNSPDYALCNQTNPAGETVCSWSVKDLDCPAQGCPAFEITFPSSEYFVANDANHRPKPSMFNFVSKGETGFDWNVPFNLENADIAGVQCKYPMQPPLACLASLRQPRVTKPGNIIPPPSRHWR